MTVFSFDYQLYPPGETEKYRPMIKVGLCYKESTAGFQALVDSGSDMTISFVEVGNALGIDFSDARLASEIEGVGMKFLDRVEGLTGGCEAYTAPAKVVFNGKEETVVIKWLKQRLDPRNDFPIILGQDSIFSFYDIHFSRRQKKFFLNTEILSK